MPSTYVLAGERLNHLVGMVAAATVTPGSDSSYPTVNLYDESPSKPWRASSVAADIKITVDLQMTMNGGFESGLTGWTTVGSVTTSAVARTGSLAASIPDTAILIQDYTCRAGAKYHVGAWIRQLTGTGTGTVYVQCLETGKYWNGTAWVSSGNIGSNATTSYQEKSSDLVVEGLDVTLSPLVTIRLLFGSLGGANTLVDDVEFWPWTDFVGVFGHRYVEPIVAPTLRSSTDNFAASDTVEATLTIAQPAFYARLAAPVGRRYWQLRLTGTPRAAPFIGELVLGYSHSFGRKPTHPHLSNWPFQEHRDQIRTTGLRGVIGTSLLSAQPRRTVTLPFHHRSEAEFQEFYRETWVRSEGGAFPLILVPDSAQPRVLYGLIPEDVSYARTTSGATTEAFYESQLVVAELAYLTAGL